MSEDTSAAGSRKDRRAQRDAARAAKFKKGSKKDKPEPAALPEEQPDEDAPAEQPVIKQKPESKKRKRDETNDAAPETPSAHTKKRKAEPATGDEAGKKRFIVFVGNLPFSTTDQSLDKHFEKLKPYNLRHRTDPATRKSKGFAFLEFENYDRLKTCLKLYHHSFFDPDDPNAKDPGDDPLLSSRDRKKSKGRRINVQLSAGGGGNNDARKEKIKTKNERLDGQRQRRLEAERKEKEKKRKTDVGSRDSDKKETKKEDTTGGMHPSRLAQLQR